MMSTTSIYDIYLEAATRLFTNIEFLASTVDNDIITKKERQPHLFKDKSKQQLEYEDIMNILNLFREISKNSNKQIVQSVLLYKPDSMTRNQFANYVSSAVALPLVKANTHDLTRWYDLGMPKALFEVNNADTFLKIEKICFDNSIPYHIVEGSDGNMKAMGVGPTLVENVNRITGNLKRL